MGRKSNPSDKNVVQTIYGVGEVEVDMVARLNQMLVFQNSGHSGSVRIGDGGTLLGHSNRVMPAQQNFQARTALQPAGSLRGARAGANQGMPNTQPPAGMPHPLVNLLLPAAR